MFASPIHNLTHFLKIESSKRDQSVSLENSLKNVGSDVQPVWESF
jgi:hypothetical protein